ncbi:hypothetical protein [Aliarcobacter butzleri]|nr:hypothetical protein [Aliarcobacter butzleri]
MKNKKIIIYGAILSATIAALLLVYTMYASSMFIIPQNVKTTFSKILFS